MTYAEIKQVVSMEEVCDLLSISHNGRKYTCPFHKDKKPSASVKNNYFHCFSCGFHGDIFELGQAMGVDSQTIASAFGYEFGVGKKSKAELDKIRKEREQRRYTEELIECQKNKLTRCRRWFWTQTHDDEFFPIKALDGILDRGDFPLKYDVLAMTKALYLRYESEVK